MKIFVLFLWMSATLSFGQLQRLPIGSYDEFLAHLRETSDALTISLRVEGYYPFGEIHKIWADPTGKEVKVSDIVYRPEELKALIQFHWRKMATKIPNTATLAGKTIEANWKLYRDITYLGLPNRELLLRDLGWREDELGWEDGKVIVPERLFEVDFHNGANGSPMAGGAIYAPNVLSGTMTVFYNQQWHTEALVVSSLLDFIDDGDVLEYLDHGTVDLVFRGGIRQTFSLEDGRLLKETLPEIVPVTVSAGSGTLQISFPGDREVAIDESSVMPPRWTETSQIFSRLNSSTTAFKVPIGTETAKFFQVRVK